MKERFGVCFVNFIWAKLGASQGGPWKSGEWGRRHLLLSSPFTNSQVKMRRLRYGGRIFRPFGLLLLL